MDSDRSPKTLLGALKGINTMTFVILVDKKCYREDCVLLPQTQCSCANEVGKQRIAFIKLSYDKSIDKSIF